MIFIRADANEKIGAGHVMRCMSIARAFVKAGEDIVFITADHKGDRLTGGFPKICLDSDWADLQSELERLLNIIKRSSPSLLLVDSYYVSEKYFEELRKAVRVAYIDDLNTDFWDLDYLINYNIYAEGFDYSGYRERNTSLLLGPYYAPLRSEFRALPAHEIKDQVTDIFVSAGGSDPEKITERLMSQICPQMPDIRFHFIVGALNPRIHEIEQMAGGNTILHINERNMSGLMQICDIGISASGSTLYEMCAAGIPTITYILADNQIAAAEQFERQEIMLNAGDCREDACFIDRVSAHLNELCGNTGLRMSLSSRMQKLVDGNGAERIADRLICSKESNQRVF